MAYTAEEKTPEREDAVQYPKGLVFGDDMHMDHAAVCGNAGYSVHQSVFSLITKAGSSAEINQGSEQDCSNSQDASTCSRNSSPGPMKATAGATSDSSKIFFRNSSHSISTLASRPDTVGSRLDYCEYKDTALPHDSSSSGARPPTDVSKKRKGNLEGQIAGKVRALYQVEEASQDSVDVVRKSLADQLRDMFGFEKLEEILAECPCWLTQNVLLQGYMYITQHHACFYAYAPRKPGSIIKSGYLSKCGKRNPKFSRYWFQLKGDELSYRTDPSDPHFRCGNLDLRYGVSAALHEFKDSDGAARGISIVMPEREYHLKADSPSSAKEWVKQLQRVIFRSHNNSDSVKICMPIENIVDVEEVPVMSVAETIKIRVANADESLLVFALEEYFFTFFGDNQKILEMLCKLANDALAQRPSRNQTRALSACDEYGQIRWVTGARTHREKCKATVRSRVLVHNRHSSAIDSGDRIRDHATPERGRFARARRSLDITSQRNIDTGNSQARSQSENGSPIDLTTSQSTMRQQADIATSSSPSQTSGASSTQWLAQVQGSGVYENDDASRRAPGSQILDRNDMFQSFANHGHPQRSSVRVQVISPTYIHASGSTTQSRLPEKTDVHQDVPQSGSCVVSSNPPISTPLQQSITTGIFPLQRAGQFAGYLKKRSKKMTSIVAAESLVYVEKVSGMLAGKRQHFNDDEEAIGESLTGLSDAQDDLDGSGDRFRTHFALPQHEKLRAVFFTYLHRGVPIYGKLYLSNRTICFRSLMTRTKMVLPLMDIEGVSKEKGFRFGYCGLVIIVRGHEELFFDFKSQDIRNDCTITILKFLNDTRAVNGSTVRGQEDNEDARLAHLEHIQLLEARNTSKEAERSSPSDEHMITDRRPVLFDDPRASILNFKPTESLKITCLTIGSRGDVQPYIALCKGLLKDGHKPKIATHLEFEEWIRGHGIGFSPIEGDPAELMRICVENGMFTYSFLKEASWKFRGWIDALLSSAWTACQETDLLIESPSAMAGSHVAEALGVPYFKAFTMPWTRTRAYPHAFAIPAHKRGGTYNELSYYIFDQVFWKAIAGQVNRWRKKDLGLKSTNLAQMSPQRVPFLYNFSPSVVVPPLDFSDWIHVTGYWFLDETTDWRPPQDLVGFIAKARADGKTVVYIGFGSIVVSNPLALTRTVVESVLKADVRCILSKGWSDRLGKSDATHPEIPLPPEIFQIRSVPHEWLFNQIDAAVHHGGAGTTGASLRAGLPTIVKPFFGDQYFFGSRVEDLGVGICLKKLNVSLFSKALWEATRSLRMITRSRALGEQIRNEDGVGVAIQSIYRDLDYARSLIKHRVHPGSEEDLDDEDWTLIGDEEVSYSREQIRPHDAASSSQVEIRLRKQSLDLGA